MTSEELAQKIMNWMLATAIGSRPSPESFPDPATLVKLVHTKDLVQLGQLPRYQDHSGITLADFKRERKALRELEEKCKALIEARTEISTLEVESLVPVRRIEVTIPGSWRRCEISVPIPPLGLQTAIANSEDGTCVDGVLHTKSNWRSRTATIEVQCASREHFAQRINKAYLRLSNASLEEKNALEAFDSSAFRAPVLFISHRWMSAGHPDPDGATLARLLEIGDAYLIIDYCAFPQPPFHADDALHLNYILSHMSKLMQNVVILRSDDYLDRGWCVYEYLISCLKGTLVCDEIMDQRYVELHRWAHTRSPIPADAFRDGIAGLQANFIQESILECVNRLLPQFKAAAYTKEADRSRVRDMLRDELLLSLPARREHNPYLSETLNKPWTAKELNKAFDSELTWEPMDTSGTQAFDVEVASSLKEGARTRFVRQVRPSSDWETSRALSSLGNWFGIDFPRVSGNDLGAI